MVTLYVTDQDAAKSFYCDVLGFVEGTDVAMEDGYRWVTVTLPSQPELQVTLMKPGPPLDDQMADAVTRSLAAGRMGGFGLTTDDCRAEYSRLAARGVEFTQPPAERPYGIEAVFRDDLGNWLVLVEPRPHDGSPF
ncbi:VOC family protein [Pseudonocardia sp. HH130630-07]|uniref:VOC family protein n=1 Tax=Pseudonocardia sp. HH130630-07 TaxID=1690815 RepID=UPI001E456828|nr:VOC family protein [Pseudonocardia sp. HH130630-07]